MKLLSKSPYRNKLRGAKNASIKMEKKLGYNIYQCQMVSSGVVSNGVEWCGVKWCRVSVMTLESLVCSRLFVCQI